jgi:hypothetical protein
VDEMQSLQFFMLFLCVIAGVLVMGTGMIIYMLYRTERGAKHVPRGLRPVHGFRTLHNKN